MKFSVLTMMVVAFFSQSAIAATVVEKKAMRQAEAKINAAAEQTKAACGNAEIKINVDWEQFNSMVSANDKALQEHRYQKQWVLSHAGDRNAAALESMQAICKDDADYKEAIAEITNVTIAPKPNFSDSDSSFKLDGTTLIIESGHRMNRSASDFTKDIKRLF
ncbi:hypothetical protein [Rheinheimera sp. WS51]|uniref:hypothetical protein n=1 Tax=Rheinheimera sp. WS51 TaxID=3425886 RepID=UPI003D8E4342